MNFPSTPDAENSFTSFPQSSLPAEPQQLAPALWAPDASISVLPSALWAPPAPASLAPPPPQAPPMMMPPAQLEVQPPPPPAPTQPPAPCWAPGTAVQLCGLANQPAFNGSR